MKRIIFMLLTVVMLMGGTISAFVMEYPSDLPELPSNHDSHILIYGSGNSKYLLIFEFEESTHMNAITFYDQDMGDDTSRFVIRNGVSVKYYFYSLNNNVWKHEQTTTFDANRHVITSAKNLEYIYSTLNVYDEDTNKMVFLATPVPLAEEIRILTEETMAEETMPELTQTIMTIVLCGVGCLALLILLPVLKKVYSRFLG